MSQNQLHIPVVPTADGLTVQEQVYARLRQAVITGSVEPGKVLTLRQLATVLGVSVTPVREAIRRLSSENALVVEGNSRIYIPNMTSSRFHALMELRKTLETHAALAALPWVNQRLLEKLAEVDRQLDDVVASNDLEGIVVGNQAFHRLLYQADPEAVVLPMVESLWLQLGPFMRQAAAKVKTLYTIDHHHEIMRALARADAAALGQAIERDILASAACLDATLLDSLTRKAGHS